MPSVYFNDLQKDIQIFMDFIQDLPENQDDKSTLIIFATHVHILK